MTSPGQADCLVLDTTSQQWERGLIGNLDQARIYASAVTMPLGVFVLGGNWIKDGGRGWAQGNESTEERSIFLGTESRVWIDGPALPVKHKFGCAVPVSQTRFLMISGWSLREFDTNFWGPSTSGWLREDTYPELQEQRHGSYGCARLGNKVTEQILLSCWPL